MTVRYRDRKTGRFASKSTWRRSKARGGTRYKRERVKRPIIIGLPPEIEITREEEKRREEERIIIEEIEVEEERRALAEEEEEVEYAGAFDSP